MENSYIKIFRPWDLGTKEEQDSTITTTSVEDDSDSKSTVKLPIIQKNTYSNADVQMKITFEKNQKSKGTTRNPYSKSSPSTKHQRKTLTSSRKLTESHEIYESLSSSEACDSPIENCTFNFAPIHKNPKAHQIPYPSEYLTSEILNRSTQKSPKIPTSPMLANSDNTFRYGKTEEKLKISEQSVDFLPKNYQKDAKGSQSGQKLPGFCPETVLYPDFPMGMEYPLYPDVIQANLAQSLGLSPQDPLFLESFTQGYAMEEYARIMTQEQQAKFLQGKKQRPKKYKCPHCDVGFSNNGQLKGHVRIHTGERPFKCEEENCGKTFTRNEELTRHKRIHSGLRPYPCQHCGKRFGRKDHLKKHTRTHFQNRGMLAVPIMLPLEAWTNSTYPYVPLYGY